MTTPSERRDLFLDAAAQTEEWNRDQRDEWVRDTRADADDRPSKAELAEMRYLDDLEERRERDR